jgi:hypothetical protein
MPAITTNPQFLLASNLSCVWLKTQDTLGAFDDPTLSGYPVRVVGTPTFAVRGAGIIARTDVYTPFGGNQSSKTGGLGWDITFTTEFFWNPAGTYDVTLASHTQLAPLFLASPWDIQAGGPAETLLKVQPLFYVDAPTRVLSYAVQPFSIVYEEQGGKRFSAYDCVCVPKISWEYGQRIMLEWTVKGKWMPVSDSTDQIPNYAGVATEVPIVGVNCNLTLPPLLDNVSALSKVTIETGWAITDVADMRETYGFGLGFIALAASPSLEVSVADFSETVQSDWGDAEANTIFSNLLELELTVGGVNFVWSWTNAQLLSFPTPADENGYRSNGLKFIAVPDGADILVWTLPNEAPPAP